MHPNRPPEPIPLHVLTGFLGAGKTTILNRLLRDPALADTVRIAARRVKAQTASRTPAKQLPSTADAVADLRPTTSGGTASVDMVKTASRPGRERALGDNMAAKPTADIKPKLGGLGVGSGRPSLGAIPIRKQPTVADSESETPKPRVAGRKPDPSGRAGRIPAKPARVEGGNPANE